MNQDDFPRGCRQVRRKKVTMGALRNWAAGEKCSVYVR